MPPPRIRPDFESLFSRLSIAQPPRTCCTGTRPSLTALRPAFSQIPSTRSFSTTPQRQNWLLPRAGANKKDRKGRPRVPTGGSTRGTTVVWGDYGLRLLDHDRRISAAQLKNGEETIRKRLRGMKYRLYTRISANIGVYTSGNESRMGKGKGSFDYWASRVAVSKIIFEIQGELHEQIVKDAFRLAGNKLPGESCLHGAVLKALGNGVLTAFFCRPLRVCEKRGSACHGYYKSRKRSHGE